MSGKKIAISDIHGCAKTFRTLIARLSIQKGDELFLLGDFVDRGPDSKGVVDFVMEMQASGVQVVCLRGNHEQMMLDALEKGGSDMLMWLRNGGEETLMSFGAEDRGEIEEPYLSFFHEMDTIHQTDTYILVHAGLNFQHSDPLADNMAQMWIRNWYHHIDLDWLEDRKIVHGHVPTEKERLLEFFSSYQQRGVLGIDGGCVYMDTRPGMGYLCAFDLNADRLFFQPNMDH